MMTPRPMSDPRARKSPPEGFIRQYWQDLAVGRSRELSDYLALFPGGGDVIARVLSD